MAAEGHGPFFRAFWFNFSCLKTYQSSPIPQHVRSPFSLVPEWMTPKTASIIDLTLSKPRRYSTVEAFEVALLLQSHQFGLTTLPEMAEFWRIELCMVTCDKPKLLMQNVIVRWCHIASNLVCTMYLYILVPSHSIYVMVTWIICLLETYHTEHETFEDGIFKPDLSSVPKIFPTPCCHIECPRGFTSNCEAKVSWLPSCRRVKAQQSQNAS